MKTVIELVKALLGMAFGVVVVVALFGDPQSIAGWIVKGAALAVVCLVIYLAGGFSEPSDKPVASK